MPHLEAQDIADAVLYCLGTPETVQVNYLQDSYFMPQY